MNRVNESIILSISNSRYGFYNKHLNEGESKSDLLTVYSPTDAHLLEL